MVYKLDGQTLTPGYPFKTADGTQFPANWLYLATTEDKAAFGIIEVEETQETYDQRFYWGFLDDGALNPKDHKQLVADWCRQTREAAAALLQQTDWMVIRELDSGKPMDGAVKAWRKAIRLVSDEKIDKIEQTGSTDELAAYITGADYPIWPVNP